MKPNSYISITIGLIVLCSCSPVRNLTTSEEKSFSPGKYYRYFISGISYTFDDSCVLYKWSGEFASFTRRGTYSIKGDTIKIAYNPLVQYQVLNYLEDSSIFTFIDKNEKPIKDLHLKIFSKGKIENLVSDSLGIVNINKVIGDIDSAYFNWTYDIIGLYPIDNKFTPDRLDFEGFNANSYWNIKIILDEEILGHPVNSNETELLIVGKNKLFEGVDYDPNVIYIGGLLNKIE